MQESKERVKKFIGQGKGKMEIAVTTVNSAVTE